MRERFPRRQDGNLRRPHDNRNDKSWTESASQMISSWLWIISREARSRRRRRSSRSSYKRNAHSIQVPIMRQLIVTTSGGLSAVPAVEKKNKKPMDKEPEDDDQGDQGRNLKFQDASKTINVIFEGGGWRLRY
jgi:hypothetical protein